MLLVVDFTGLDLGFRQTDIRLDDRTDITAGKLISKICDGVEALANVSVSRREMLDLLDPKRRRIDATQRVGELHLKDWDTIYVVRRGSC